MYGWRPYVPAAKKRATATRNMAKIGDASPIVISGRTIASSFWGKAWCDTMESYGDYANRLPRGRTYVRNGSVLDLRIAAGVVEARVSGSRLYTTTVRVVPLSSTRWRALVDAHAGQVSSMVDLLQGKLPASLLRALADRSSGLFPTVKEISFACTCPDWASMCKHVAAVLYGVGARLDRDPGLFFTLRGVDVGDLVARSSAVSFGTRQGDVEGDLGDLFGIELDTAPAPIPAPPPVILPPAPIETAVTKPAAPKPAQRVSRAKKPAPVQERPSSTVSRSTLRTMGASDQQISAWLDSKVFLPTGEADIFGVTPSTSPTISAWLVARPKTR